MEQISYKWGPYKRFDSDGKERWTGTLPDGRRVYRSQLIMMNHLHYSNIPKVFSVHHINENTTDDRIENLLLMGKVAHHRLHKPRDYSKYGISQTESPAAYQRAYRADVKERYLAQRRRHYQEKLKDDSIYICKRRERANSYWRKLKDDPIRFRKRKEQVHNYYMKRKGERNENNTIQ